MKRLFLSAGLVCVLAAPVVANGQATSKPSQPPTPKPSQPATPPQGKSAAEKPAASGIAAADQAFVKEAAMGGMAEVDLGQLAASKAADADVKQFGQRMVDDHGKANEELKSWASSKGVMLPTELDAKHKAEHAKLEKLSGEAFDKAYMASMVADHNTDVAAFQREAKAAKDPELKAWVAKTLPTLEDHQKSAKEISAKVHGTAAGAKKKPTDK
jgi:putative membrane protein